LVRFSPHQLFPVILEKPIPLKLEGLRRNWRRGGSDSSTQIKYAIAQLLTIPNTVTP